MLILVVSPGLATAEETPVPPPAECEKTRPFEGDKIRKALDRGAAWLFCRQIRGRGDENVGAWPGPEPIIRLARSTWSDVGYPDGEFAIGQAGLITYALLESGVDPQNPNLAAALDWLVKMQSVPARAAHLLQRKFRSVPPAVINGKLNPNYTDYLKIKIASLETTYDVSLRALALEAAIRHRPNPAYTKALEKDVKWLLNACTRTGGYTYCTNNNPVNGPPDNSNSQYGVLGVWAGARAGMDFIPSAYWKQVYEYWSAQHNEDGGWDYHRAGVTSGRLDSYPAMTAAGVASLFVCMDNVNPKRFLQCGGTGPFDRHIEEGLNYLARNFENSMALKAVRRKDVETSGGLRTVTGPTVYEPGSGDVYGPNMYYLYCLERVGLASGFKYFDKHDWFKKGAAFLLDLQQDDGSWVGGGLAEGNSQCATAYAMLFLARGQKPVLFNKLWYDGDWLNRPRALANLTRWIGRQYESEVFWQIINLNVPVREWHDAPILHISGSKAPEFSDADLAKIRTYVEQGGTVFSTTECDGVAFKAGIRKAYQKMFPRYELTRLGTDHPLYAIQHQLRGRPALYAISNGIRPLVIHTDVDLPVDWQFVRTSTRRESFEAATNIFLYLRDKEKLRHRGTTPWPDEPKSPPPATIRIARVKYGGNWNPEPLALKRFALLLAHREKIGLDVLDPVELKDLAGCEAGVAVLSGTSSILPFDAAQTQAVKAFVATGGTLVVDAAGGAMPFFESAGDALRKCFGGEFEFPPTSHPLYQLPQREINKVKYRRAAQTRLRTNEPRLRALTVQGRPAVLLSREDITAGLVGYECHGVDGYNPGSLAEPGDAYRIMRNVVLYAAGAKAPPATPAEPGGPTPPTDPTEAPASSIEKEDVLLFLMEPV
jgi:hypothetical protein